MKRKIFASALSIMAVAVISSTSVMAVEPVTPYELPYDIETGILFEEQASSSMMNDVRKSTWGTLALHSSNPLIGNPRGYAFVQAPSTAKTLKAKIDSNNNGTSVTTSGWKTLSNTTAVNSGTITASTSRTTFTAYGELQNLSGQWFTNSASRTY